MTSLLRGWFQEILLKGENVARELKNYAFFFKGPSKGYNLDGKKEGYTLRFTKNFNFLIFHSTLNFQY